MLNRRIAIVGAGVAGTRLAYLLARHGIKTQLFDHKAPWEKPCGGGLTAKVFNDFTDINRWDLNGRANYKMSVITPFGRRIVMTIDNPIVTVSRMRLGNILLDEAIRAGVRIQHQYAGIS